MYTRFASLNFDLTQQQQTPSSRMSNVFSPSSTFLRATSPANFASIEAQFSAVEQSEGVSSRRSRCQIFQGANSINDIIAIVPQDYRHVLREPLLRVVQTPKKANAS